MSAEWLQQAAQRARSNAQEAANDPHIKRRLRDIEATDQRLARMQEQPQPIAMDRLPTPKTAPRQSRHAARPQRARMAYRPHTLEERRDDALMHDYVWNGIERTAPPRVVREYGL